MLKEKARASVSRAEQIHCGKSMGSEVDHLRKILKGFSAFCRSMNTTAGSGHSHFKLALTEDGGDTSEAAL